MIPLKTNLTQDILNAANQKIDRTYYLHNGVAITNQYIVSIKNIVSSKNCSLIFDLNQKINNALKKDSVLNKYYDSIGVWTDPKTNITHVDINTHFNSLELALDCALNLKQIAIYDQYNNKTITV